MVNMLPNRDIGIIGHSISASLAFRLAAANPRVTCILTTGAMGAPFRANKHTVRTWTFPETRDELRRAGESLVYDSSIINDTWIDARAKALHAGTYGDYFRSMFAGDKQQYIDEAVLDTATLARVRCKVLMVHGKDDKPFPFTETTLPISRAISQADIVVLAQCGHSPALEHPKKLLHLAEMLFE
jgi:2-hydroxymuconate-semialdehyde hydrolase